jgi:hypothetical protein
MFNRDFGAAIRLPYVTRQVINQPHHGGKTYPRHSDIGDVRINGIYSGFFDDMSTGLTFGLKLPTGESNAKNFARNTQIGSGTTDSILGFYHRNNFGSSKFGYFVQGSWERPFASHKGYMPGYTISSAVGSFYNLGQVGKIKSITPILQITSDKRGQDRGYGDLSHNKNSGYSFFYFNPAFEIAFDDYKLYLDVGLPIYRSVKGNQLVPQNTYKVILGYNF